MHNKTTHRRHRSSTRKAWTKRSQTVKDFAVSWFLSVAVIMGMTYMMSVELDSPVAWIALVVVAIFPALFGVVLLRRRSSQKSWIQR